MSHPIKLEKLIHTKWFDYNILNDRPFGIIKVYCKNRKRINIPIYLSNSIIKKLRRKWLKKEIIKAMIGIYKAEIKSYYQKIRELKKIIKEMGNESSCNH